MIPVKDLKEGDSIRAMYAVRSKEPLREYRNREGKYFFFVVGDKTGDIMVKYWGGKDPEKTENVYASLKVGDVVELSGEVEYDKYTDRLVIRFNEDTHTLRRCSPEEYDVSDFLPTTQSDTEALYTRLLQRAIKIENPHLRHLVMLFLDSPEFAEKFRKAPGSATHHYNYIGGNLEHTLNLIELCDTIADQHPELKRDLLITAAILHDIGKIPGYEYTTSIDLSTPGKFLGHVNLSYTMVKEKIEEIDDFPEDLAVQLYHIILTHHSGDSERYSTRRFKTPEACAFYHANLTDTIIQEFIQAVNQESGGEDDWTYSRTLGHQIYTGDSDE